MPWRNQFKLGNYAPSDFRSSKKFRTPHNNKLASQFQKIQWEKKKILNKGTQYEKLDSQAKR